MTDHRSARETAEARFAAKQLRTQEARRALTDYEADCRRVDERTARLRALRLAKEAAEKAAAESHTTAAASERPARSRRAS